MHQTKVTTLFWKPEEGKVQVIVFRCREGKSEVCTFSTKLLQNI